MSKLNLEKVKIGDVINIEYGCSISKFKVLNITEDGLLLKHVWFFGLLTGYLGKIIESKNGYSLYNFDLLNPKYNRI